MTGPTGSQILRIGRMFTSGAPGARFTRKRADELLRSDILKIIRDAPCDYSDIDIEALRSFLGYEATFSGGLPVWLMVRLGEGPQTGQEFLDELKRRNRLGESDDIESYLLSPGFKVSKKKRVIKLVVVTPLSLGFPDRRDFDSYPTVGEVVKQAYVKGLRTCPPDTLPQLLLQHEKFDFGPGKHHVMSMVTHNVLSQPNCRDVADLHKHVHDDYQYVRSNTQRCDRRQGIEFPYIFMDPTPVVAAIAAA